MKGTKYPREKHEELRFISRFNSVSLSVHAIHRSAYFFFWFSPPYSPESSSTVAPGKGFFFFRDSEFFNNVSISS